VVEQGERLVSGVAHMCSRLTASPITSPGNRGILADHPAHWQRRPRQVPLSVAPRRGHAPDPAETPVFLTNHQRLDASMIAAIYEEHWQRERSAIMFTRGRCGECRRSRGRHMWLMPRLISRSSVALWRMIGFALLGGDGCSGSCGGRTGWAAMIRRASSVLSHSALPLPVSPSLHPIRPCRCARVRMLF
jgi:hypothetical protein